MINAMIASDRITNLFKISEHREHVVNMNSL